MRIFPGVPEWWEEYEPTSRLKLSSPIIFQYFTQRALTVSPDVFTMNLTYAVDEFVDAGVLFFRGVGRVTNRKGR